jgi:phosphatidylserine decarboxylase
METPNLILFGAVLLAGFGAYLFWRYIWFFRNPPRSAPAGKNIVSPADGTVVYVKQVQPREKVISIKKGVSVSVNDITRTDLAAPKYIIGVFMSPFNVHHNRMPLTGTIDFVKHHPAEGVNRHMGHMHWRSILNRQPLYTDSLHIFTNERTVTKFSGKFGEADLIGYIIQIAGKSVHGIDSYVKPGQVVPKGEIFGMIRIGSQVDLVVTQVPGMRLRVKPGDKVVAGETIVLE